MANFLKSLFVKGVEIDPAGATNAQVLSYNGTKFVPVTNSATATTSATDLTSGTLDNARLPAVATTITSVGTLGSLAVTNGVTAATFTGALVGNASTATNVAYTGLTGTVPTWNQNTTGTAATVTGAAQTAITSVGTLTSLNVSGTATVSTTITNELRTSSGQQLIINAGESHFSATGQTDEFLYVNAEKGLVVNSSPDNWVSGWAGRKTATICATDGTSTFPGTITAPTFVGALTGNASTATNVAYTGLTGTVPTWNQNTTGNAATVTTNANLTGDITSVGNATAIASGVIVNADINTAAAIDLSKLATTGTMTATTFVGALTGTASGNLVSGGALGTPSSGTLTNCTFPTLNQNTTGTAATVTGAAQTAITSVGTLTGLTVAASSGTAMQVTNTGTGNSFLVEDQVNPDSSPFVIDASGNVGIGKATPAYKLDVNGQVVIRGGELTDGISLASNGSGSGNFVVTFQPTTLTASRLVTLPDVAGTMLTTGNLSSITSVGTLTGLTVDGASSPSFTIGDWAPATQYSGITGNTGYLLVGTNAADTAMYLRTSTAGAVNIGANNSNTLLVGNGAATLSGTLTATGGIAASYIKLSSSALDSTTNWGYTAYGNLRTYCAYGTGIGWLSNGSTGTSGYTPNAHATFMAGATVSGDIRSSAINTTTYSTSSDYRLKENITEISDAIERIRRLKPVSFQFKDPNNNIFYDGFLAHEVQEVIEYAVGGAKDAVTADGDIIPQMIDMSTMVGLLTAGIKELDARLAQLETI